jgi:hypothetical protein
VIPTSGPHMEVSQQIKQRKSSRMGWRGGKVVLGREKGFWAQCASDRLFFLLFYFSYSISN